MACQLHIVRVSTFYGIKLFEVEHILNFFHSTAWTTTMMMMMACSIAILIWRLSYVNIFHSICFQVRHEILGTRGFSDYIKPIGGGGGNHYYLRYRHRHHSSFTVPKNMQHCRNYMTLKPIKNSSQPTNQPRVMNKGTREKRHTKEGLKSSAKPYQATPTTTQQWTPCHLLNTVDG